MDYYDVMKLLEENGAMKDCDDLCVDCYSKMLSDIGYKMYNGRNNTVADIARHYPDKRLLLRLEGHLTCCIDGICYDLWDCTKEPVDVYWVVD